MSLVAVGMSDISSKTVTASVGQHLSKGDELGYFQFGGSTHCLIFNKGVIGSWFENTNKKCVVKLGTELQLLRCDPKKKLNSHQLRKSFEQKNKQRWGLLY